MKVRQGCVATATLRRGARRREAPWAFAVPQALSFNDTLRDLFPMPRTPPAVTLVEVSPRDGLQNEKRVLPVEVKVELIDRLGAAGFACIEVTSFVSPTRVPQLADAAEVMARLRRLDGVRYPVLVPNMKGYERAIAAGARAIVVFGSASETFSQRNINCSIDESMERFAPVVAAARAAGIHVRGTVSCALGCPYEGEVAPAQVAHVAGMLDALGVDELSIADTIGVGTPEKTIAVMEAVLAGVLDATRDGDSATAAPTVNGHFHDTYGRAIANIGVCLDLGIRSFDASVAGIGGCPFAPGATGNVATEDVLALMERRGFGTGVDAMMARSTGEWIRRELSVSR
jgi:hydroxymethylglutaryl-CoA lyase